MKFTKMHGCGNDGVFLDALADGRLASAADGAEFGRRVRALCDRTRGVGADVVIVLGPSRSADARMRIFNADGHEAQMCSTGVRGAAKLLVERHARAGDVLRIETGRGVLRVRVRRSSTGRVEAATIDMGEPIFEPERIPMVFDGARVIDVPIPGDLARVVCPPCVAGVDGVMSAVSMGNPHAVFWCRDLDGVPLELVGPAIERHPLFPQRVNAHFVQRVSGAEVRMRSWERGAGATMACGTGACAVVAAGVIAGRLERRVRVRVPGGEFEIEWASSGQMVLTGPITELFDAEIREDVWPEACA